MDLLVFNPPYVPTYDEEAYDAQSGAAISSSWAGGKDGMRVTDILLDQLDVRVVSLLRLLEHRLTSVLAIALIRWAVLLGRSQGERHPRHSTKNAPPLQHSWRG